MCSLRKTVLVPGNPKPRIYWMRNGQVLNEEDWREDGHFRVTSSGRYVAIANDPFSSNYSFPFLLHLNRSLVVYNVSRADAGMYECVAENERERRTASAQFRIRGEGELYFPNTF